MMSDELLIGSQRSEKLSRRDNMLVAAGETRRMGDVDR